MFPPGKSGGLIEASTARLVCSRSSSRFRRVNPAASLKLGWAAWVEVIGIDGFRRVNPAASLKQLDLVRAALDDAGVSAG